MVKAKPMGVKQLPEFTQDIMEMLLRNIEECKAYISDIG